MATSVGWNPAGEVTNGNFAGTKLRVFVDWVADLFARSDLIQTRCCMPAACAGAGSGAEQQAEGLVQHDVHAGKALA